MYAAGEVSHTPPPPPQQIGEATEMAGGGGGAEGKGGEATVALVN